MQEIAGRLPQSWWRVNIYVRNGMSKLRLTIRVQAGFLALREVPGELE